MEFTRLSIQSLQTPCYVFDLQQVEQQIQKLKEMLPEKVALCYAMKANPFIVGRMKKQIDYFEVCSPGEFKICEETHITPEQIIMSGVYKNEEDMAYALATYEHKIEYTVESLRQWDILCQYAKPLKKPLSVLLRLSNGSQFGMDKEAIASILEKRDDYPYIDVIGIQYFSGTQKKGKARICNEVSMLDEYLQQLQTAYGYCAKRLEFGPGLPITYFEGEDDIEDEMIRSLAEALSSLNFNGEIVLEMGRIIVASCGTYITKVVDMKRTEGKNFCIVDGGIHQMNYYGQMMAMKKPFLTHIAQSKAESEDWTVCGSLCTMNDVLLKQYPLKGLQLNDCLAFHKVGAYSVTEGISLFLSRNLPSIYFYDKNGYEMIRDSFPTYKLNSEEK